MIHDSSDASFKSSEDFARQLDIDDPLRGYRERFLIPPGQKGDDAIYLCGNSLGLQPVATRGLLEQELDDWARLAVEAHFDGRTPWYSYHEVVRDSGARLVGARPTEVVMMNSLTVNLHLMMVSFYRPVGQRRKILMEYPAFPSDTYAMQSQLICHGFNPSEDLLTVRAREGRHDFALDDIEAVLEAHGSEIAVVMLGGVNFYTGQLLDMPRITELAHRHGCRVGFDLAHAAGNVPLALHDWDIDFAVWCSYKYLNAGPGAVAGCYVHERHGTHIHLPRFAGWWGNDPATRFRMHLEPEFIARPGADGWQLSNPPILALAPLRASLDLFDAAGMKRLRGKSELLTAYLQHLLTPLVPDRLAILTPPEPDRRGCQLSLVVRRNAPACFEALKAAGVMCDLRPPDVIRVAPVPLYNTFTDVWRALPRSLTKLRPQSENQLCPTTNPQSPLSAPVWPAR